ncbi:LOW QUALITY PROTEIN: sodium/hydrogen exchanger 9-like [Trematomus bernacchii]|uniref:LOW QUALITY PROTEIN: sodium/hydrogen exchanger 9-like n=1 Tax=Trematomus bernacchii TaxID=40690 RepID=UPI00146F90C1|nr:LOW QUALITY PROTEIN: sodium/hydrogen exchanger 9-like [Trematomus bernacchii]
MKMEQRQENTTLILLSATSLALLTILTVWKSKQCKYRLLNETGGAMFYGMLVGLTVKFLSFYRGENLDNMEALCNCSGLNITPHFLPVNITSQSPRNVRKVSDGVPALSTPHMETFDPEVLFNLFLPPIIFHGAYTLNQKRLIGNLGSVLTFAFLGTVISCFTIGSCVYGFTRLMVLLGRAADGDFLLTDCLLFGAIVSATDPVAVLGLLSELRLDLDLHSLLFGESVLNDAVAIVLTHGITTYSQMGAGQTFDPPSFLLSVGYFLAVFAGSLLLGFTFTITTALLTKFTRLHENPLLETSVFFLLSWSCFLAAKASGLSGIVAVLFCGLSQARYTFHNLSSEGRTRTKQLFEVFNFLGEIFIFSYMGYVLLTFPRHVFKALFITGAFLSICISRACNIYPLSFLLNLGRTTKIPRSFQHFMVFAGFRGAVAFSLAVRDTSTEARRTILSTTLLLVGFTTWVLGTSADPMLHLLNIRVGVDSDGDETPEDLSFEVATGRPDTTRGLWHRLDYKFLKPLLTHCGPPLTDTLPQCCGLFARLFSCPHVQEDEEQVCEADPDDFTFDLEKTEEGFGSEGGDCGPAHQEDLLEGDLGLGTDPPAIT